MPAGATAHHQTTKTDFARYLDANENAVPSLREMVREYRSLPRSRGHITRYSHTFGFWLRNTHYNDFIEAYLKWWMKHPELFDHVYDNVQPDQPDFARNSSIQVTQFNP
jgi:hypothetical protein